MEALTEIKAEITARKADIKGQMIVAISGPPGSGKSTIAAELAAGLEHAAILGMDGFHFDNVLLEELGLLERKGAPETFDVGGLISLLSRLRSGETVCAPVFDRALDVSRGSAQRLTPDDEILIVEGNYLLLDEAPWSALAAFWDLSVALDVGEGVLKERLVHRWLEHGFSIERAHAKAERNDLPNARRLIAGARAADVTVKNG